MTPVDKANALVKVVEILREMSPDDARAILAAAESMLPRPQAQIFHAPTILAAAESMLPRPQAQIFHAPTSLGGATAR